MRIATTFDFQPLDGGSVMIEFFGDDRSTFHMQVVTAEVMKRMVICRCWRTWPYEREGRKGGLEVTIGKKGKKAGATER